MTIRNRHVFFFVCLALVAYQMATAATAATLYYDGGTINIAGNGNGAASGTTGNWNTALMNWDAGPVPYVGWTNANNDIAFFSGGSALGAPAGGTVTLTSNITVGGLVFGRSGYNISTGANALTFGGANNTVTLNNGYTGAISATITGALGVSSSNMNFTAQNPLAAATLTFTGTNTTGWTGTTTIKNGLTVSLSGLNQALVGTTAITLNSSGITITSADTTAEDDLDRVNNSAGITSNGGTLTYTTTTAGSTKNFIETFGTVDLVNGQLNLVNTLDKTAGSQTLALSGLTRTGATSAITFSNAGGLNLTNDRIRVNGITADTAANEIIGAWATVGTAANTQTDYAVYDSDGADGYVVARNIAASAESTWSTGHAATSNYTLANTNGSAANGRLSATRNINTLRNNTAAGGTISLDTTTDIVTMAGSTFADGDVIVLGTANAPLVAGVPYYIRDAGVGGAGTFRLATTSGGAATNFTANSGGTLTGGITLSSGNNLGTYGILNGSAATLAIGGSGTGAVTLPTTTSDKLYVTAGNGPIAIAAPITDNGAGVLTLVKNGSNTLTLSGNNTFTGGLVNNAGTTTLSGTNTFGSGVVTINGGAVTFSSIASWGGATRNVTFNGTGTLTSTAGDYSGGTLTSNAGAIAVIAAASSGTNSISFATTTGAGNIIFSSGANRPLLLGNASTFTGTLQARHSGASSTVQFSSIADSAGSAIQFVNGGASGDSGQTMTVAYSGTSALTFDNRQIQMLDRVGSNWENRDNIIANNSANAAHTWTINTDFLYTGGTAITAFGGSLQSGRSFVLSGSNTGDNAFNGVISDGQNTNSGLVLKKEGAGKWILSDANTHSGGTTLTAGTLIINNASALGTGTFTVGGNATFDNTSGSAITLSTNNPIALSGGSPTFTGSFDLNMGTGAVTLSGANRTITVTNSTATLTLGGNIGESGSRGLTKSGLGTLVLNGASSNFTGTMVIDQGTLQVVSLKDYSTASSIGQQASGDVQIGTTNTGTLLYTGSGDTTNRTVRIGNSGAVTSTAGAIIGNNGTGGPLLFTAANFNSTNNAYTVTRTLSLRGSNTGNNEIQGIIKNDSTSSGVLALAKSGTGKWILSGANTYTGATTVNAGTLLVNGSTVAGSAFTVGGASASGTPTLGGTGTIGGTVTIASAGGGAAGILSPGASIESLASGALTMNSGSTFIFEAMDDSASGADLMVVNGILSLTAANLDLTGANLAAGTWTTGDKLTLISYNYNGSTEVTSGFTGYLNNTIYAFGLNNWQFMYDDTTAGSNYNSETVANNRFVTMELVSIVPEPSSLAMLAFGVLMLGLFRKRK